MFRAAFGGPDLIVFCRLDDYGLTVTGLVMTVTGVVLECCVTERDLFCRGCGAEAMSRGAARRGRFALIVQVAEAMSRGAAMRSLVHVLFGNGSSVLVLRVRWYRCEICGWFW